MKVYQCLAVILLFAATAYASELSEFEDLSDAGADARLFFVNFTSSLVQVNATLLAYALVAAAIIGAVAIALYYLFLESQNNTGYGYGQSYGSSNSYGYQQYAR